MGGIKGGIGLGINHHRIRLRPVSNPHLAAIDHITVAPPFRPQPHTNHIRTRIRLAHRQRPHILPADQPRQITPLLRLRPIAENLINAQIGMRPITKPHAGRTPRNLLHNYRMRQIPQPRAPIFLRNRNPQQPQIPQPRPQIPRKFIAPVNIIRPGPDFRRRKPPHRIPHDVNRLPQIMIQRSPSSPPQSHIPAPLSNALTIFSS